MNHIGSVIQQLRNQAKISRKELSYNICSDKYLYLIEKGERTPSAEIIRLLGYRLGTDLFTFYEYLDCMDPIYMKETIAAFTAYRNNSDFTNLKVFSDGISQLPDFQNEPWCYEIRVNNLAYQTFAQHEYIKSIADIKDFLKELNSKWMEEEFVVNLYILLSTCYQVFHEIEKSKEVLALANQIILNKQNIPKYYSAIISVKLNIMTLCHMDGNYDTAIETGLWINQFCLEYNCYERVQYTYYYLAYAYYKKQMIEKALDCFQKCLFDLIIHPCNIAAYYISHYDLFCELFYSGHVNQDLAREIKTIYKFIPEQSI